MKIKYSLVALCCLGTTLNATEMSLDTITVSASINDDKTKQEIPCQIDKIKPDITASGSLGEAVSDISGVHNISTGPQAGNVMIRGMNGERIKILSNGFTQDFQGYGGRHIPNIDPNLYDNIEVIRGASGVLYGSNAIGGVVNMLSPKFLKAKDGESKFEGNLESLYHTNNNERDLTLKAKGANGKYKFDIAASKKKAGNYKTADTQAWKKGEKNDQPLFAGELPYTNFDNTSARLAVGYVGEKSKISLEHTYWNGLQNYLGHGTAPDFKAIPTGQNLTNNETTLNLSQDIGEWVLGAKVSHLLNQREAITGDIYNNIQISKDSPNYVELETVRDSVKLSIKHPYIAGFVGEIGVDGYNKDQKLLAGKLAPSATEKGRGVYIFEEGEFDKWIVQAGARYDMQSIYAPTDGTNSAFVSSGIFDDTNNDKDFSSFGGSFGASYALSDDLRIATNLSQGFRSPSIFELYAGGIHGGVQAYQIGNSELKEEISRGVDLSLRYLKDGIKSNITAYYNNISDYIYIENTGNTVVVNGQTLTEMKHAQTDAAIYGIELDGEYQVLPLTSIRWTGEMLWGEDTTNDTRLPYLPPKNFSLGVTQNLANYHQFSENSVSLDMKYYHKQKVASKYEQFAQYNTTPFGSADTDSYALFDLGFNSKVKFESKNIDLKLKVSNLFDRAARNYLDTYKGYSMNMGRDISLSLSVPF